MSKFVNSKWYHFTVAVWEVVFTGLLWTLFSIPLITMGASSTALYYVCTKKYSSNDDIYIFRSFWKSFKENFKNSTIVFLILAAFGFLLWLNWNYLPAMEAGPLTLIIRIVLIFVVVQLIFTAIYIFAIIARFETPILGALKAANFLANRHIFSSLTSLVLLVGIFYVSFLFPFVILFAMGIYGRFSSFQIVRIFQKHYPYFEKKELEEIIN